MSQFYVTSTGSGPIGPHIEQINGDIGSITGNVVKIYANNIADGAGSSVLFENGGTISTLRVTDTTGNTMIGNNSGNSAVTADSLQNTALGQSSGRSISAGTGANTLIGFEAGTEISSGFNNVSQGASSLNSLTTGNDNCAIGTGCLRLLVDGNFNLALGSLSGINYTANESSNILINHAGVASENNTIRLGTDGNGSDQQNKCYVAGILNNTVSSPLYVTIDNSGGVTRTQLGVIDPLAKDLHTAKFIVSSAGIVGTGANYATIASALFDAPSGSTIFIMPGTYNENLNINKSLTFCAYTAFLRDTTNNVIILGKATISAGVQAQFFGIQFTTNGDVSLLVSGAPSNVTCQDCYFNATNANSISQTGANSNVYLENCSGNFANTRTLFTSSAGDVWLKNCLFVDATTPGTSTCSSGQVYILSCYLFFPLSCSSTGKLLIQDSTFGNTIAPFTNTTWITTEGTGTSLLDNCTVNGGTSSAISVGAGTTLTAVDLVVQSTNANAITGAGTIIYGNITFTGSSSTINTSTQTAINSKVGSLIIKTPITITAPVTLVRDSVTGEVGVSTGSIGAWTDVTGSTQTLAVGNGYLTDRALGVTYTLPASASIGDTIKIVGKLGLATITPNANQQILIGSTSGSVGVGGTCVANNVGDCIELICTTSGASTVWRADSVIGTWTLS